MNSKSVISLFRHPTMLGNPRVLLLSSLRHGCPPSRSCSGIVSREEESNTESSNTSSSRVQHSPRLSFTSYEAKSRKNLYPLILNHNLMGTRSNLSRVAKEINRVTRRLVVNVDCRNHGESPKLPEMTYDSMSHDVLSLMSSLEIPKTSFLGTGMGGRVGMLMALRQPSLLDKLIVINSTPLNHMSIMQRVERIKMAGQIMETCKYDIESAEGIVAKKSVADKILTPILKDSFDRSLFLTNLVPATAENDNMWKLNFNAIEASPLGVFPTFEEGVSFKGPCLFITGDKCDYMKEKDLDEVSTLFPNAKFIRIPDTGYWLHVERYRELLEIILPFLTET
uniref:sn-1-specific diacylglycerol lipase ABHD11 n=1 Tax=Caligus clemensi TaxID=344056 RepID=C1C2Z5_CALCM|nr:Abhydrolase domain-containing protein 11 [Caligus clemensi]